MPLKLIRLELARTPSAPDGDPSHRYEFVAPLDKDGHLDQAEWRRDAKACTVHRLVPGQDPETGQLVHTRHGWAFSYEEGDADDEPIFKFDRHRFVTGEYVTITEHDGVARPFKVADIRPAAPSKA
ncbi:MAG: hypothetical protein AB7K86_01810 [Rhodospirillales bacterium]